MQTQNKQLWQNTLLMLALSISIICLFSPIDRFLSFDGIRLCRATSLIVSYCLFYYWMQARHQHILQSALSMPMHPDLNQITEEQIFIVYASQTGYAEQLAIQTQSSLQQGGMQTQLCNIAQLSTEVLTRVNKILFVVSTTGEGDAPDSAAKFTRHVLTLSVSLKHIRYAILALGDRNYKAYCAFGHQLDHWLHQQGALALFDTVEVDNADEGALRHWQHHLGVLSGHTDLADWHQAEYECWTLNERRLLNPGSQGNPVFQLRLTPPGNSDGYHWQAGDIAEILPQVTDSDRILPHREYSIASIPQDGALELIVRQARQANGSLGLGSGWLTQYAEIGGDINLRLRTNRSFHPPDTDCALILIGNGTGIAGLRAHLKHRAERQQHQNWLFFGERNRASDFFCQGEIEQWQANGVLSKLDLAFSRDQTDRIYVQDKLRERATELIAWVANGAAVYVCGSLEGMAGGVDESLREILGTTELERMREEGLYRRDVY